MLKAIDLHKKYKPKDGQVVNALDGVSVDFPETGMVFILGKSGSGKSTLLNVLGGLDKYDSGEVIVKGKSSKDFSQADFDSYRNTFIGFIFQEYNILQEFSVEKNIGLALELQGKKADKEAINSLIEQVDLKGYGKRKPNTLSGGQKQRVAIARALVKNPEIIMADEPTGALDSKTGAQVLDTLKKLSKEKLVIVVSHDREFAEYYADRIIELADGKIISDQFKHEVKPKITNGLEIVDDKVLTIKKGTKLDDNTLNEIETFLLNQNDDVIISVDNKANKEFKKFAKINDEGLKETFRETTNDDVKLKDYDGNVKLIRSKLPMKDSIKMGASGLKTKRFRLFLTILLSLVAFGLFGLADTMASYNKIDNTVQSLKDSNIDYASFEKMKKRYWSDDKSEYGLNRVLFNDEDVAMLKNKFNIDFLGIYGLNEYNGGTYISNMGDLPNDENVMTKNIAGAIEGKVEDITKYGSLMGEYPKAYDEIVITEYVANGFVKGGYKDVTTYEKTTISSVSEIIGKQVRIDDKLYKVVGILDTHFNYDRYKSLNDNNQNGLAMMMLRSELEDLQRASVHTLAFMKEGFYQNAKDNLFINSRSMDYYINFNSKDEDKSSYLYVEKVGCVDDFDNIVYYDSSKTTLNKKEIILETTDINSLELDIKNTFLNYNSDERSVISANEFFYKDFRWQFMEYCRNKNRYINLLDGSDYFFNIVLNYYAACNYDDYLTENENEPWSGDPTDFNDYVSEEYRDIVKNEFTSFLEEFRNEVKDLYNQSYYKNMLLNELKTRVLPMYNSHNFNSEIYDFEKYVNDLSGALLGNYIWFSTEGEYSVTNDEIALVRELSNHFLNSIKKYINANYYPVFNCYFEGNGTRYEEEYRVVGIHRTFDNKSSSYGEKIILSKEDMIYKTLANDSGKYYLMIGKISDGSSSALRKMVELNYDHSNEYVYELRNNVMYSVENVNEFIESAAKIFLYIGIGFAVFASLLLLNFISVSISYKKREIGILRAIGARGMDVFKIFFSEAFIIAIINFILAFIGCIVACYFINRMFRNEYGFLITILHVGIRQLLLMFGISFVVAFISSFIPVYLTARKKPIDAIRNAE